MTVTIDEVRAYLRQQGIGEGFMGPPMDPACRVAVVIPYYNEERHLARCLGSLRQQRDRYGGTVPPSWFEIICVDNNSSDRGTDIVAQNRLQAAEYRLIMEQEHRQGPGWARKKGIDTAVARFSAAGRTPEAGVIAWIDADCEAHERWVSEVLTLFDDPAVMVAAGDRCYAPDLLEQVCAVAPHAYLPAIMANEMIRQMVETLHPLRTPRLNGANAAVRLSAYIAVGGMQQLYADEAHGLLAPGEDVALGTALQATGQRIWHIPAINVHSARRLVHAWLQAAEVGGDPHTYGPVFECTDEAEIMGHLDRLREISERQWREMFVWTMDSCTRDLLTRDMVTAVREGRDVGGIAGLIYGGEGERIVMLIKDELAASVGSRAEGIAVVNGFYTASWLEAVIEKIFWASHDLVDRWLWSSLIRGASA